MMYKSYYKSPIGKILLVIELLKLEKVNMDNLYVPTKGTAL